TTLFRSRAAHAGRAALRPAGAVPARGRDAAVRGRAPGAGPVRGLRDDRRLAHRRVAAGRDRGLRPVAGRAERLDGDGARAAFPAGGGPAAARVLVVPSLPRLPRRRDAAVRAGARGAASAASVGRWDLLPRARGGRGDPQRARRDRAARGRAGGVRDAARAVLRARRRGAAGLPEAVWAAASGLPG